MRSKTLILIFVALSSGLVASIGISQAISGSRAQVDNGEMVEIFVAASEINIGDRLNSQNVKLEPWPKAKVPEGSIKKFEDLEDQTANQRLYSGEVILTAKLGGANDLPRKIPPGYRAVPVKLNVDTVIGLIRPGDRVDVLVFLRRSREVPRTGTRTILRNIRVFSVNKNTERISDNEGKTFKAKTVSLLVKPSQVETLMLAKNMGKIQLSLRRPEDEIADRAVGGTNIAKLLGGSAAPSDKTPRTETKASGGSFLDWLRKNDKKDAKLMNLAKKETAPTPPVTPTKQASPIDDSSDVKFRMVVHGPGGATEYRWRDEKQLPEAINVSGEGATVNPASSSSPADGGTDLTTTTDISSPTDTDSGGDSGESGGDSTENKNSEG